MTDPNHAYQEQGVATGVREYYRNSDVIGKVVRTAAIFIPSTYTSYELRNEDLGVYTRSNVDGRSIRRDASLYVGNWMNEAGHFFIMGLGAITSVFGLPIFGVPIALFGAKLRVEDILEAASNRASWRRANEENDAKLAAEVQHTVAARVDA